MNQRLTLIGLFSLVLIGLFTVAIKQIIFLPPSLSPVKVDSSQTANLDSTSNWKTFSSDVYGFDIKYPGNWNSGVIKIQDTDIFILTPAKVEKIGYQIPSVSIDVIKNINHLSSIEFYNQIIKPKQVGSVCTSPKIIKNIPDSLKNMDVTIIEGLCGIFNQGPSTIINRSSYIFYISSGFEDKVDNKLVYQMLSTIKFTN